MNKIEELILDFVDAWGFKLSGKISDEDMLSEEKNKNMTKDLKEVIQQAVEEERERIMKLLNDDSGLCTEDFAKKNGCTQCQNLWKAIREQ